MYVPKNITKYVVVPLLSLKNRDNRLKYIQELERTQWYPLEDLENIQEKRLRALIKHAYNNVPYYHRIFKERKLMPGDIRRPEDLIKLPILTKEDIRANFKDLLAVNSELYKPNLGYTGGSTGKPLRFYKDKINDMYSNAALKRAWRWAGLDIGDKYVDLWGHLRDIASSKKLKTKIYDYLINHRMLDAFSMGERELEEYTKILRKFKPKVIRGYASAIYLLARFMKEKSIWDVQPHSVITTSEKLFDFQREIIEDQLNCKIFDTYSGKDHMIQACECEEHVGYHIATELGVMEFVKDGKHVSHGELGKILITEFYNYSMPFIRYENEDMGIPSNEVCPCGRGLPLIKEIEGRTTDFIVGINGNIISSPALTVVIGKIDNIKKWQIIQKTKGKMTIRILREKEYSQRDTEYLVENLHKYVGKEMEIDVKFVDTISPSKKTGKYRFIISEVPIKFA